MARADLFVLASDWEGFGNVIAESMACGTPVVSTDCPVGPNEIIFNDVNGVLVPVGDVGSMVEAVCKVAKDEVFREKIKKEAYRMIDRFDIINNANRYERVLLG